METDNDSRVLFSQFNVRGYDLDIPLDQSVNSSAGEREIRKREEISSLRLRVINPAHPDCILTYSPTFSCS